jgi:hypothetical protein
MEKFEGANNLYLLKKCELIIKIGILNDKVIHIVYKVQITFGTFQFLSDNK